MTTRLTRFLPKSRRGRWLLGTVALLIVVWLALPRLAAPYVRGKLQAMIASKVDAELRMGRLTYLPPFGVRVRDARLIAHDRENGGRELEVVKVAQLDLRLAKLPFRAGPLVIQRVEIRDPQLHLVYTDEGLLGAATFARARETPPAPPPPSDGAKPLPPPTKLSDMFELRHLALSGGKLIVEDRTRHGLLPMEWSDLNLNTETSQTSHSGYRFQLKANHTGVASLDADGAFDLDEPRLTAERFKLDVTADPAQKTSGLPADVQSILRRYDVAGKVAITGTADVPVGEWKGTKFDVRVAITDASARLDKLGGALDHLGMVVHCRTLAPDASAQPRAMEFTVERFDAHSGPSNVTLRGTPVLNLDHATGKWTLDKIKGAVNFGDGPNPLQLAGRIDFEGGGSGPITAPAAQTKFEAADYHATLRATGLRVQPPKWPLPLENIGGKSDGGDRGASGAAPVIELRPGVIVVKDLAARYGQDDILLTGARITLPKRLKDLKKSVRVEEIVGHINFHRPNVAYPGKFGKMIAALQPAGPFEVGGGSFWRFNRIPPADDGTLPAHPHKSDWFFGVSTDGGSLSFAKAHDLILDNIRGDASVSPMLVDIPRLECSILGGTASASGKILPQKPFIIDDGKLAAREVDLAQLARVLRPDHPSERLTGRGFLNLVFGGSVLRDAQAKPDVALRGRGEFEVIEGDFWNLPVIGEVASAAKNGRQPTPSKPGLTTLGEAAGTFHLDAGAVVLENAAVSAPALGLIGAGSVGFIDDKSLDLHIVAAPLGDWRDRIKQTKIPILSDVVGDVVGGIQRLVNTATSTVLYEFRVGGTLHEPTVQTVPAPVLTDPAALLFGRMLDNGNKQRLIESVRPKDTPSR